MLGVNRVAVERSFALEGGVEHQIGVGTDEPFGDYADIEKSRDFSLKPLETFPDSLFYRCLRSFVILRFQCPDNDMFNHVFLLYKNRGLPFRAAPDIRCDIYITTHPGTCPACSP